MLSICFHSDGERDVSVDEAGINGLLKMQRSTSVLSLALLHDGSSSNNLHALDLASSGMGYPHNTPSLNIPSQHIIKSRINNACTRTYMYP